ncbi:hypothetical protein HDU86_001297 [Geranomyces michiganensis]|nr:hypothetical protein HDU86_001297 [Geranomyces michiganensis]
MLWQSVVVALAAVLLLTAERHHPAAAATATATSAVPANSYPLYPYYSITWNNTSYNVTWAHTQSAFGNLTAPYPYPVIQSQGQVIPYPYPNFDYPCAKNVSGKWYNGTCSLGGRGRGNVGGCKKSATSTAAAPARRDILTDVPNPTPADNHVVLESYGDSMPKINAPGLITGVYQYARPPSGGDAARLISAVADAAGARTHPDRKPGQYSPGIGAVELPPNRRRDFTAGQNSADLAANVYPTGLNAPDGFREIPQSGGANATAALTRRATRDCSMVVSGFVDGVLTPDGGGNVTGTCEWGRRLPHFFRVDLPRDRSSI